MSTFSGSPRLPKGAIVGIDIFNPLASVIVFQCNPDTLTRNLRAQTIGNARAHAEVLRLTCTPTEAIKLETEIHPMKGRNP
jgi:hypothetical protein